MVSIAKTSLLNDLEAQREQELAEARAIQVGMPPQGRVEDERTVRRVETFEGIQIDSAAALQ